MKAIKTLLVAAAVAAAGLAAHVEAYAQEKHGLRDHGGRHWHGGHGHRGHWRGSFGFFIGAPLAFGWGAPWYYDPWYYGPTVVYREREVYREPVEIVREPTTEVLPSEGAPKQGPMYMNYCESAQAYYPKVTSCPEGWKLTTPTQ